MTYRAIPSPDRRFGRVVRAIAAIDLVVCVIAAVPFSAAALVNLVFEIDDRLGLGTPSVILLPSFVLPINVAGLLGILSALGRLADQSLGPVRLDVWRRLFVAALILYFVLLRGQTPVVLLFVATELATAVAEAVAARRFARTTGA